MGSALPQTSTAVCFPSPQENWLQMSLTLRVQESYWTELPAPVAPTWDLATAARGTSQCLGSLVSPSLIYPRFLRLEWYKSQRNVQGNRSDEIHTFLQKKKKKASFWWVHSCHGREKQEKIADQLYVSHWADFQKAEFLQLQQSVNHIVPISESRAITSKTLVVPQEYLFDWSRKYEDCFVLGFKPIHISIAA